MISSSTLRAMLVQDSAAVIRTKFISTQTGNFIGLLLLTSIARPVPPFEQEPAFSFAHGMLRYAFSIAIFLCTLVILFFGLNDPPFLYIPFLYTYCCCHELPVLEGTLPFCFWRY